MVRVKMYRMLQLMQQQLGLSLSLTLLLKLIPGGHKLRRLALAFGEKGQKLFHTSTSWDPSHGLELKT